MDILYLLFLSAFVFSLAMQIKVSSTFSKYSKISAGKGHTASAVARRILDAHGLFDIDIERVRGNLTDHYDPKHKVLRLSDSVYDSSSSAAVGVAAHEVGHAIQHSAGYLPIKIRGALVPAVNFASRFCWIAILVGLIFMVVSDIFGSYLLLVGVGLFSATTLFHLVTLPCEFNASSRALTELELCGWYSKSELDGAKRVLTAAAMTYVAALAMSVIQLLRLLTLFNNRRR